MRQVGGSVLCRRTILSGFHRGSLPSMTLALLDEGGSAFGAVKP